MYLKAKAVICDTSADGRSPLYPGDLFEIDDATGRNLILRGAATEMPGPAAQDAIPQRSAKGTGENPSEGETARNGAENANNGQIAGHLDAEQLQEMSYTELKALAKDMGIEAGKIKSKAGMIEAITAVEVYADDLEEAPPVFGAQDVIEE